MKSVNHNHDRSHCGLPTGDWQLPTASFFPTPLSYLNELQIR